MPFDFLQKITYSTLLYLFYVNVVFAQQNYSVPSQRESSQISNMNIKAFCQDSLGYMWIATPRGLNRYNGYEFLQYFHDPLDSTSLSNDFVHALFIDSSHRLWIGTSTGVDCYNFERNSFKHYPDSEDKPLYVYSFFEDSQKKIWVATVKGVAVIDMGKKQVILQATTEGENINLFWEDKSKNLWMGLNKGLAVRKDINNWRYLTLPGNREVKCIYHDPQGTWWLGTNKGIILFDPAFQTFKEPSDILKKNYLLNNIQVNFIKEISPLKLLIGTGSQGIFLYDIPSQTLMHNEPSQLTSINSTQLLSCYIDRDQNVWIGSFDKGFIVWNNCLNYFNSDQRLSNSFKNKFVTRIVEDSFGNLWIGTRYRGLFHYAHPGKFTGFNNQNSELFINDNNVIESLFIDSDNRIWIGLTNGLIIAKISQKGEIKILSRKSLNGVGSIKEDSTGNYWIGSPNGLYKMKRDDPALKPKLIYSGNIPDICILNTDSLIFSSYDEGIYLLNSKEKVPVPASISTKNITSVTKHCITIFKDKHNGLWMGSYGAGFMYMSPNYKDYRIFDKRQGLPSNDVLCFEEDNQGDMWMSTSYGISRFRMSDSTFINYFSSDGTLGNQYHEKAGLRHTDGRIFFAGNHGLTFFNPMADTPIKSPPTINLTDLKILNRSIKPSSKSILEKNVSFVDKITLNHKQTVISIDYTGIDFLFTNKLNYAYKLEGFDKNWNFVGNYRRATYSNLKPGEYTFKVKAINGVGLESNYPATIKIKVNPAPWFSWPAWLAYIFIFITSSYLIFRLILNAKINKSQLETEHREREREKQISEMKMNFFTNISHEFRTPLTLISAPLEQLLASKKFDPQSSHLLNTISRNVHSMLRLINQLLDFNRMEGGMLDLQVQQTDIIHFIRNIEEVFFESANGKQIALDFIPHTPSLTIWVDTDKIEKILYNLLSNALKFTPQKGKVEITTRELRQQEAFQKYAIGNNTYLEITVSDTGPGIPKNKLQELFIRYRQIDSQSGRKPDYSGSGIGLHYTKRLVETHHGNIKAILKDEKGMAFSFILPLGDVYPESNKLVPKENYSIKTGTATTQTDENINEKKHGYTILIAEDNVGLMDFIRELLEKEYELIEALDGSEAWSLVQSLSPDLILSDVLMPGLSGYELCGNVKQHPQYSHIPVILLTAKSTIDDQLEGLEQGADAYICKPFNVDYLLLTIKNLFKSRAQLRKYLSTPRLLDEKQVVNPVTLNAHDQKFMDNLTRILEEELANPDLNIDTIARNLGFSRTGFYRKMKGLCDMSPSDFFRTYRLKRAAEMIRENSLSLNEIATYTGFNFYPHFSKLFKKQFGVPPKDYLK